MRDQHAQLPGNDSVAGLVDRAIIPGKKRVVSIRRFVPIEEVTLSIGRASEYASSTTLVERPAHLFTKLSLRSIALFASIGN
jgi:hypothetical protein